MQQANMAAFCAAQALDAGIHSSSARCCRAVCNSLLAPGCFAWQLAIAIALLLAAEYNGYVYAPVWHSLLQLIAAHMVSPPWPSTAEKMARRWVGALPVRSFEGGSSSSSSSSSSSTNLWRICSSGISGGGAAVVHHGCLLVSL